MSTVIVYENATGKILGAAITPTPDLQIPPEGAQQITLEDDQMLELENYYIQNSVLSLRPEMPMTINENIITVPPGTFFSVVGEAVAEGISEDGVLDFEFSEPGEYIVRLSLFPYLDKEVTLEN